MHLIFICTPYITKFVFISFLHSFIIYLQGDGHGQRSSAGIIMDLLSGGGWQRNGYWCCFWQIIVICNNNKKKQQNKIKGRTTAADWSWLESWWWWLPRKGKNLDQTACVAAALHRNMRADEDDESYDEDEVLGWGVEGVL